MWELCGGPYCRGPSRGVRLYMKLRVRFRGKCAHCRETSWGWARHVEALWGGPHFMEMPSRPPSFHGNFLREPSWMFSLNRNTPCVLQNCLVVQNPLRVTPPEMKTVRVPHSGVM